MEPQNTQNTTNQTTIPAQPINTPPTPTPINKKPSNTKYLVAVIILSILAVCGFTLGIVGIVMSVQNNNTINNIQKQMSEMISESTSSYDEQYNDYSDYISNQDYGDIYGYWLTSNGTYFEFDNDEFFWWKTKDDLTDNYYYGDLEIFHGYDAIEALGTTYDKIIDIMATSEGTVDLNDIYALKLYPTFLMSGGVNKTDTLATNFPAGSDYMLLSFIITGNDEAQAYNYNMGDTYYLEKE